MSRRAWTMTSRPKIDRVRELAAAVAAGRLEIEAAAAAGEPLGAFLGEAIGADLALRWVLGDWGSGLPPAGLELVARAKRGQGVAEAIDEATGGRPDPV